EGGRRRAHLPHGRREGGRGHRARRARGLSRSEVEGPAERGGGPHAGGPAAAAGDAGGDPAAPRLRGKPAATSGAAVGGSADEGAVERAYEEDRGIEDRSAWVSQMIGCGLVCLPAFAGYDNGRTCSASHSRYGAWPPPIGITTTSGSSYGWSCRRRAFSCSTLSPIVLMTSRSSS